MSRHGAAIRPAARASWPQWCRDTIFVSWKGVAFCVATRRRDTEPNARYGAQRAIQCCDTAPSERHSASDTALCARSLDLGCAHYAPDLVLTQCTVLSHYLDHCSWTHEHCSRGFKKIKKYKIIKFLFVYDLIYGMFILHYV